MRRSQLTKHVSFINDLSPCSDRYHETMTTEGTFFILEWYITMLWPLSWDEDKWRSMIHILEIYYHALTERCHETMTTDRACFIHKGYITMLWPLSWDYDNWRSMFHTWMIYYHALTVVIRRRQLSGKVSEMYDILLCSDQLHETMTTDRVWFIP